MLSEQAKAALERIRRVDSGENQSDVYGVMTPSGYTTTGNIRDDLDLLAVHLLDIFPVHTLNGMVIRWDDEITPERLVASGGQRVADLINWRFQQTTTNAQIAIHAWHTETDGLEWEVCGRKLPWTLRPTNMGEVWQLMEKCGCPVGGDK